MQLTEREPERETQVANSLAGYTFCLTGKMWDLRETVERLIRAADGSVSRTLSKNSILVLGETPPFASKKQLDAARNGHAVISDNDLRAAINSHVPMRELIGKRPNERKSTAVEPIDREQHQRTVKQVFDDIEAIAFGK